MVVGVGRSPGRGECGRVQARGGGSLRMQFTSELRMRQHSIGPAIARGAAARRARPRTRKARGPSHGMPLPAVPRRGRRSAEAERRGEREEKTPENARV